MSVTATRWAWETDLPTHLKIVLLAIADFHNGKTGQCNPRVEVIAEKVGVDERTIRRALKALSDAGYIAIAKRRKGHRQASSHYNLALDGVVFQNPKRGKSGCHVRHPETDTGVTLYIEPEYEHIGSANVIPLKRGAK